MVGSTPYVLARRPASSRAADSGAHENGFLPECIFFWLAISEEAEHQRLCIVELISFNRIAGMELC
jgi:hypothetical protein